MIAVAAAGCGGQPATPVDASQQFTFEVDVSIVSPIDQVTVNGALVPIISGSVTAKAYFPSYTDGMMAVPMELAFYSQSQLMSTGHAVAGACQELCLESQCADPSRFVDEQIQVTAGDFRVHQWECLHCVGPSGQDGACE